MIAKPHKKLALLVASCLAMAGSLGACTAGVVLFQETRELIWVGDVNYREKNYAAADYLSSITLDSIDKNTLIVPLPLMHANNTGMTSTFGEYITREVGERFAQLGYNVYLPIARNPAHETNPHYPLTTVPHNSGVALDGTYKPDGNNVAVRLRMVNRITGQIITSYDYTLPVSGEVRDMMEDKPVAFKTR